MTNKVCDICNFLDESFPNAKCALIYHQDYELVIAVMLSAQTTDKSVNRVTEKLFSKYPTLDALADASYEDIFFIVKSLGLAKTKAKNVLLIAQKLVSDFSKSVPSSREELMKLPGVGRKTANVIRCEIFHQEEFPVDTHVARISKRLRLASEEDNPEKIEIKLRKAFPSTRYTKSHHQFIQFGREICTSSHPKCNLCKLQKYCLYFFQENK